MSLNYTLRKGDEGQEVARLQLKIGNLVVDGKFGKNTDAGVQAYQNTNKLVVDGIAGPATLGSLGIEVLPAIDLSRHNGKIDYINLSNSGIKHAWIKVTEGTTHVNPGYEEKFKGCRDHGITVGAYHFGRPDTYGGTEADALDEAKNFLDAVSKVGIRCGDLLPVLDLEAGMKTDDQLNIDWATSWLEEISCSQRVRPIVYTAKWYYDSYMKNASKSTLQQLSTYPLWIASYNTGAGPKRKIPAWDQWAIWQWTGSGSVPGVVGKCDQNWIAGGQLPQLLVP